MTDPLSHLTPQTPPLGQRDERVGDPPGGFDPLRLCVNATVALITCVLGPIALLAFAAMAVVGYARARRAGLMRSKCKLGDTRVVLAYLALLAVAAVAAVPLWFLAWRLLWQQLLG